MTINLRMSSLKNISVGIDTIQNYIRHLFDSTNSTYRHSYESEAGGVIYIGNEDVIAEYKKEIRRFINHMKGDIEKIELIPCVEKMSIIQNPKK